MRAMDHQENVRDATTFVNGWVVGYMAAGGQLTDEGLADRAVAAYEKRLHPPDLPEPVAVPLERAIQAAVRAERRMPVAADQSSERPADTPARGAGDAESHGKAQRKGPGHG